MFRGSPNDAYQNSAEEVRLLIPKEPKNNYPLRLNRDSQPYPSTYWILS